ncbi:TetR/AcrR family transcriptional regulator [Salinactinospora qingdaonensis]|uniref:TetR/AcrR family transcriptional regulator n=1 Tax=Salinactinospora qingdaonensis TaxID=702744 RepID=A0ABP7FBD7_9ACTN
MAQDWRARKRARTKEAIQHSALRLFLEHGYDATTVARIAEEAGVSHMTFFRYFPTKEDVVLSDDYDPMIEELVRARPTSEPPIERVRAAIAQGLTAVYTADQDALLTRTRLLLETPALRARLWENLHATQRLLERALDDTDATGATAPLRLRVIAGASVSALTTAVVTWAENDGHPELPQLVDEAFAVLEHQLH